MKKGVTIILLVMVLSLTVVGSVSAKGFVSGKTNCFFRTITNWIINNAIKMQRAIIAHHPLDPVMHDKEHLAGKSGLKIIVDPLEVFAD